MDSSVPYLIRAINDWILDNDCTPYLVLDADADGVAVPPGYARDGQIVLNISPAAIRDLVISSEFIMFSGRFGGVAHEITAPIEAVLGIIARENGEGMWFPKEDGKSPPDPSSGPPGKPSPRPFSKRPAREPSPSKKKGPPDLKVVK